jgi:hypothetical protein
VQVALQLPEVQVPLRQLAALVQAPGVGVPQRPPAPQTPLAHWLAPVQATPLGSLAAQTPSRQARPWAQLRSLVQEALQRWATQLPLRQLSPVVQPTSLGWPQKPSPPHWPARQAALVVQGPPAGTPQTPAVHTPLWQALGASQDVPLGAPQVPSVQTPLRQVSTPPQAPPLGRPQKPSPPQVPERHWAGAVQARALGRPQRSSAGSQVPPAQTARPTAGLQTPPWWRPSLGSEAPAGSLVAVQVSVGASQ